MGFIAIYITHANERSATKVANFLVEQKLVACANIFPMKSAYWWKAQITSDKEWVSIVKTRTALWSKVIQAVESVHPYDVPCIMKFEVEANTAYEDWIRDSTIDPAE